MAVLAGLVFAVLVPTPANAAPTAAAPVYYTATPRNASIYEMRASYSWRFMDVMGGQSSPGAGIQTFDCKNQMHQRFYFVAVSATTFVIQTQGCGVSGESAVRTRRAPMST